jgi:hypothetical protein
MKRESADTPLIESSEGSLGGLAAAAGIAFTLLGSIGSGAFGENVKLLASTLVGLTTGEVPYIPTSTRYGFD